MGIVLSQFYTKQHHDTLNARIQALELEISNLNQLREHEAHKYGDETARLKKKAKEDEEKIRRLEGELMVVRDIELLGTEYLVELMKEQQKQKEVAVEKWKQLYLTIKTELDDLILRTKQEMKIGLGVEEGLIERLQMEVTAKEEAAEALRLRVLSMEKEGVRREREIDILKQSLKILNNSKRRGISRRNLQRHRVL